MSIYQLISLLLLIVVGGWGLFSLVVLLAFKKGVIYFWNFVVVGLVIVNFVISVVGIK